MSDTPKTDALVQEAEKICLEAGLSGMFFWREMYGRLLSRMRREEIEGKFAEPEATFTSGWISIKDRKPDELSKVLTCWDDGYIYVAMYHDGLWHNSAGRAMPTQNISHWMPLPSAPLPQLSTPSEDK